MNTFTNLDIKKARLIKSLNSISEHNQIKRDDVYNSFLILFFVNYFFMNHQFFSQRLNDKGRKLLEFIRENGELLEYESLYDIKRVSYFNELVNLIYSYLSDDMDVFFESPHISEFRTISQISTLAKDVVSDDESVTLFDFILRKGKDYKIDRFVFFLTHQLKSQYQNLYQEVPFVSGDAVFEGDFELVIRKNIKIDFYIAMKIKIHGKKVIISNNAGFYFIRDYRIYASELKYNTNNSNFRYIVNMLDDSFSEGSSALVLGPARLNKNEREALLQSGFLHAVIELPGSYKNTLKNMYFLRSRKSSSNMILFIKTDLIYPVLQKRDDLLAAFIKSLLRVEGLDSDDYQLDRNSKKIINHYIKRYFPFGYRNIPGLVSKIDVKNVLEFKSFSINNIIIKPEAEKVLFSPLDDQVIYKDIHYENPIRGYYVIGNNGVGKSLLLYSLAERIASENKKRVLLLCFGLSDRFYSLRNKENILYLGDKQSGGRVSLLKRIQEVSLRVLNIYQDDTINYFFEALLLDIGFSGEIYFVPSSISGSNKHLYDLDKIIKSSELGDGFIDSSQYSIAIKRKTHEEILMFDNLSSGEQLLLLMLARIISEVQEGSVVIIDEPEISMHICWQQKLPYIYDLIAEKFNAKFIVATHSPILINSVNSQFNLSFIASDGILEKIGKNDVRNVESTIFDVFNVATENNRSIYEHCARIVSDFMDEINIISHEDETLNEEQLIEVIANKQRSIEEIENILTKLEGSEHLNLEGEKGLLKKSKLAIEEIFNSIKPVA